MTKTTKPKKKGISTKSAKAKARRLQNHVAELIRTAYTLPKADVSGAIMGEGGMDIRLSAKARAAFPYAIECKAYKSFSIYKIMQQAQANCQGLEPIAVIKGDHKRPLAVIDLDLFIKLTTGNNYTNIKDIMERRKKDD